MLQLHDNFDTTRKIMCDIEDGGDGDGFYNASETPIGLDMEEIGTSN